MSPLEIAANLVNLVSILLANLNSVHTWWTGIVGCALFAVLFGEQRLYADVSLQVFFVVTSALGWWAWQRGGHGGGAMVVRRTRVPVIGAVVALGLLVTIGYGALLAATTNAFAPVWDSAAMTASIAAQLLLMRRRVENWWFWLIANTVYVPLYLARDLRLTAVLYAAFWVNALISLRRWQRLVAS